MLKKNFSLALCGVLLSAIFGFQTVSAKAGTAAQQAAEARAKVLRMGVGSKSRVEVKLRDDSQVKGYVSASSDDSFTVMDSKTGAPRTIAYADVAKVKKSGGGLSTRAKLIIGAAAAAGAVITWIIVKPALCDGGAQTRGIC
ncbi:MAG: hypothetical protein H0T60_06325 [Acidobacteria bacterium]|nr:hypothetical protein [Acidobacteriota bacterium]